MPPSGRRKNLDVANVPKPENVSLALWIAVERMSEYGKARGLGRPELAKLAGVRTETVSKWLARVNTPDLAPVMRFEVSAKLESGSMTRLPGELGKKLTPDYILAAASSLGLDQSILDALAGDTMPETAEFSGEMKRAVLGVVHILGYPLEIAAKAARQAQKENPGLKKSPAVWIEIMRPILDKFGPPGSGTFPSSANIKLG